MPIDQQDTQPLSIIPRIHYRQETSQERYRRLKAQSDRTGVRLLFVYLREEHLRRQLGAIPQVSFVL